MSKNLFDKLADAFGEQKPASKVTIDEIIRRKTSMVLHNGKLYRVTAEEVEPTKKS
jgi:hypothetical protein